MFYTNEYTVLYDNKGENNVVLKPNITFNAFEGDFTVSSFARIKSRETNKIILELQAGSKTTGVGTVVKRRVRKA